MEKSKRIISTTTFEKQKQTIQKNTKPRSKIYDPKQRRPETPPSTLQIHDHAIIMSNEQLRNAHPHFSDRENADGS